jgi:LCP family protein required for cell wall assembly
VINILLIGQDRRAGETRARSDAMILCTFHTGSNTLTMTSFMRDLWVQIPGYQDNKLNAAYVAGGMKLLDRTLEKNFGIQIDGNVEVDFQQFIQIIDLLGGVEIELRADEAKYLNRALDSKDLSSGPQTLTGQQALCYARIRSLDPDADFSRTNRQRKVMEALIQKYRSAGTKTALSLLDDILPMVTTDMSKVQIAGYARDLLPELSSMRIVSQRIPAEGTFTTPVIRNMSVLLADMDAARKMLQQTLEP